MDFPKSSLKLYRDDPFLEDPVLAREFRSASVDKTDSKYSAKSMQTMLGTYLRYRNLTIYTAPSGFEFITGDNYVIPLPTEEVESFAEVPFSSSTEFLMPMSSSKVLFVSRMFDKEPTVSLSRKSLSIDGVRTINNTVCIFSSGHIFSKNEELLKKLHKDNPFYDGKIVVVGGEEYSFFEHPKDLPKNFR